MLDSLIELHPAVLAIVPITIGLAQVVKGYVAVKWVPLGALALGIVLAMLAIGELSFTSIIQGLALGLIAMGLYSGGKATIKG